jgi:hypothetical protein
MTWLRASLCFNRKDQELGDLAGVLAPNGVHPPGLPVGVSPRADVGAHPPGTQPPSVGEVASWKLS